MSDPVRLAKRLAALLPCSRREAELYIAGGFVTVDGLVVEQPQFMVEEQKVELAAYASLTPQAPASLLFHQSADAGCPEQPDWAATRALDDDSGIRPLKLHFFRLTESLPLERNASGLRVYTQDFRVARKLKDEAATLEQEYVVEVAGTLPPDGLELLNCGLRFNGRALPPIKVSWQNETRLRFALKGVQTGQIAHMCESVGLQVQAMRRLRIGRVSMARLQPGSWRYLKAHERF